MIAREIVDRICVLRLDAPPLNALTPPLLEALGAALRRAEAEPEVAAIVVAGRADHFSAGADVALFERIADAEAAARLSRRFQEALGAVEASAKPVVAALAGRVVGGALELALACHARVAAADARFAMPEVNLGINPGAGGTARLPRLIGVRHALRMLLDGTPLCAREAFELGLVDELCPAAELIDRAVARALAADASLRTRLRTDRLEGPAELTDAFARAEERVARVRPELIAPREILRAVRIGIERSFEDGLEAERTGFGRCIETRATRNKIHLFFATRRVSKISGPAGVDPTSIERAAVVGMGSMGTGIAQALIAGGVPVAALDERADAVARASARIARSIQGRVRDGKLDPERARATLDRFAPARSWEDLAGADLVIEAVFEDAEVKAGVLRRLEDVCGPGTILATNTSTLSLDALAGALRHPDRFVGLHFFNPAHRMPLVEVIRHRHAAPETLAAALALARRIGKTPVPANNREGFIVNRLFIPYIKEAFRLMEEGAAPDTIDATMVRFGFPMGPLALIDMAGIDILDATDRVLRAAFPRHGPLPGIAERLVAAGCLGQKSGAGVYRYEAGERTPRPNPVTHRLLDEVRAAAGIAPGTPAPEAIAERLVLRMVAELSHLLDDGVARCEDDVDVATVLGIGFPDFLGGVARYARDLGSDAVAGRLARLVDRCGVRFTLCPTRDEPRAGGD